MYHHSNQVAGAYLYGVYQRGVAPAYITNRFMSTSGVDIGAIHKVNK